MKEGEASLENFVSDLQTALLEHRQQKTALLYEIASSMVNDELKKPHTIVHMCEKLLENNPMEISLNPNDALVVKNYKDASNNGLWQKVTILANDELALGSLVIKTHNRIIEAHVADQINLGLKLLGRQK